MCGLLCVPRAVLGNNAQCLAMTDTYVHIDTHSRDAAGQQGRAVTVRPCVAAARLCSQQAAAHARVDGFPALGRPQTAAARCCHQRPT
jgi:hypothetical protein